MASESPDVVVVAPVVVNGGAESSNGKDEQLESELSKKLEIAEDGKEDNDEDEGSKAETSTKKKKKKKKNKSKTWQIDKNLDVQKDLVWIDQEQQRHYILGTPSTVCSCQDSSLLPLSHCLF